jgi:ubiquitin C-terminal hydrolase
MTLLKNLGNTCFINSILQCFDHLNGFHAWMDELTPTSVLVQEYNDLRKLMRCNGGISPGRFVHAVYTQLPFQRGQQADAHEFLIYLLDALKCPLFQGKQISCVDTTRLEEPFLTLLLPVHSTLEACMNAYFNKEEVEWGGKRVMKWYEVDTLPPILCLVLKRFTNTNHKNNTMVDIPLQYKDYELQCVCNHYGGTNGGHYTATVYTDIWCEFSDDQCRRVNHPSTPHAYCLFYRKKAIQIL